MVDRNEGEVEKVVIHLSEENDKWNKLALSVANPVVPEISEEEALRRAKVAYDAQQKIYDFNRFALDYAQRKRVG